MIRAATFQDIPVAVALAEAMHGETSYRSQRFDWPTVVELFHQLIIIPEGCLFVAEQDDELVGFLAGGIGKNYFGPDLFAFEYGVYLKPGYRRGMAGARLAQTFLDWADSKGVPNKHMAVSTGIETERTGQLYQHLGAREAGRLYTWGF